ncbi:uncharacterized protein [Argopecten irradians]|uniref:uncharacterized protein n=1 Tax=Argopecten irradians TaxID=31199 RepID=UPI00372148D9
MIWQITLLVLLGCLERACGGACSSGTRVGNKNPQGNRQHLDSTNGLSVLHQTTTYQVSCTCGEIYEWNYYAGATGTVHFQVWRDIGSTFELVGENVVTITTSNDGSSSASITSGRIYVAENDYIGLYVYLCYLIYVCFSLY